MKITNAQAKLERAGFSISWEVPFHKFTMDGQPMPPCHMTAQRPGSRQVVEVLRNGIGESVATIRVRSITDHDDSQSDYCAGSFWPSIAAAIAAVGRWDASHVAQAFRTERAS